MSDEQQVDHGVELRDQEIKVGLTKSEKRDLCAEAKAAGVSTSDFIRSSVARAGGKCSVESFIFQLASIDRTLRLLYEKQREAGALSPEERGTLLATQGQIGRSVTRACRKLFNP